MIAAARSVSNPLFLTDEAGVDRMEDGIDWLVSDLFASRRTAYRAYGGMRKYSERGRILYLARSHRNQITSIDVATRPRAYDEAEKWVYFESGLA